jgi:putative peptidoglycan lipid II flippase
MAFRTTFLSVVAVTLTGHFVGLFFEIAAAERFGTGREADALAFALVLIVTVTAEVVSWIGTLFVPLYVAARVSADAAGAVALLRRVFAALVVVTAAGAILVALAAPIVVATLAPALGARGVAVLRAFAPLLFVMPLGALLGATLQVHGRFKAPSARHLAWYGGGLAGLLAWGDTLGAAAIPLGMAAGGFLYTAGLAAVVVRFVRARSPEPSPRAAEGGPSLARLGVMLLPLVVLSALAIVNVAVERALAARLPEGSLAALTYAYRLVHFPLALFLLNATTMLLPSLAGHAVRGEAAALEGLTRRALRITVVFAVPLAALALALAGPLTHVLFERGAFTAASTSLTATAIAWSAPGVVALAIAQVLVRAYQALHAFWALTGAVGAGIAVNVVLMTTLTPVLGLRGLPLAQALSGVALVLLLVLGLRGRAGALRDALVAWPTAGVITAGLAACGAGGGVGEMGGGGKRRGL